MPNSKPTSAVRPLERAQLVWRRALELADPLAQRDQFAIALDLVRAAYNDPAIMAHALTLGRTYLRAHADDAFALGGARILEAAITFVGVEPRAGDVSGPGRR